MELPQRKQNRLENFDYNQNGAYFITICVKDRKQILCDIVGDDAHIVPKKYGTIVEKYMKNVAQIKKYVIMPDHIHMIIHIDDMVRDDVGIVPYKNAISNIVRSIKILVTKEIGKSIFQRSYYDHVIRNQDDYNETWEYIENNPAKWVLTHKQSNRTP